MANLFEFFGNTMATEIKNNLSNAYISEIYDNSVDMIVPTSEGDFTFGVYCYYADGDDERPLAGAIDFASDTRYMEFSYEAFSKEERDIIQNILDNYQFKKGQFLSLDEKDL